MGQRIKIKALLESKQTDIDVTVKGWVRTFRNNQFIALNDGSTNSNIQVVVDFENTDVILLKRITTGAALSVKGLLVASLGKGQTVEVKAKEIEILGDSDPEKYPLQPKKHSLEFLREPFLGCVIRCHLLYTSFSRIRDLFTCIRLLLPLVTLKARERLST
jgi:asparaginyl-tRNA synthetase